MKIIKNNPYKIKMVLTTQRIQEMKIIKTKYPKQNKKIQKCKTIQKMKQS